MKLSALVQPGALHARREVATATPATPATQKRLASQTVASVATVAVADSPARTDEARRLWSIVDADGRCWSVSYCPPASAAEVRELWPDALSIEPEDEPEPTGTLDPADEARVCGWLAAIGETDPQCVGEVLAKCAANDTAMDFYLRRAEEVIPHRPQTSKPQPRGNQP